MSGSLSSPEESRSENKLSEKHKWRGKLFPTDSRFGRSAENLESTDDDIANFLHITGTRLEGPLAPRIGFAADSRRSSIASVDQCDTIVDTYRGPKPRQKKGLSVRFDTTPPVVVGVGGDEAELPPRDVLKSFAGPARSETSPDQELSQYKTNDKASGACGRSPHPFDETTFRPSYLRRRATGIDEELLEEEKTNTSHVREAVPPTFSNVPTASRWPRIEEQDLNQKLQKRHPRVFTYNPCSTSEDSSYDQSYTWQTAETRNHEATRHLSTPPPRALPANSLTPTKSLGPPHVFHEPSISSYHFPPAAKDLPQLPDPEHQGTRQESQDISYGLVDKPLSLRTVASSLRGESLNEFDSRVQRFNDLFRLNASTYVDITAVPLERWLKTSAWWFLRGKGGLESAMYRKSSTIVPANAENDGGSSSTLKQAYIDLAKALWVLKDVTPNLPGTRKFSNASMKSILAAAKSSEDQPLAELVEVHLDLSNHLRALTTLMKENEKLPPHDLYMQSLEPQVFLETPNFAPDIARLMANNLLSPPIKSKSYENHPFFPILVGDTERHFSFGKMFVDVFLDSRDDAKSGVHIPCVVSVIRERSDWAVKAAVASQDGQVNLVIQSDKHGGLHWRDVQWKITLHTMQLRLQEGVCLQIRFSEKDFKTIWGICDYTKRVQKEYSARRDEELLYERELLSFQCFESTSFPAEPINGCRMRLFARKVVAIEGSAQHEAHDGYRLMVITPQSHKTLSKVNYQLGKDKPILFSTHRRSGRNTLLVRVPSSLTLSITFYATSDAKLFRSTLAGTLITEDDHCSATVQLQRMTITSLSAEQDMVFMNTSSCVSDLSWQKLCVVNRGPPNCSHNSQSTARSEYLRILADCEYGTITDRINTGELQLSLGVESLNQINLLRAAQQDMTWCFADGVLGEADLNSLSHMLQSIGTSPSIRTYHFHSLLDLHSFQAMLTGFYVLYDGLADTFSISRRRMVVLKRWEASTPRLQIIKREKTIQLIAFFKGFSHGASMNFVLKVTDSFETFARSGVFFLRIIDAKFALPRNESDPARDFVCLDMPEYPTEHDDIIIGFDSEQGKHLKRLAGSSAKRTWTNKLQIETSLPNHCLRQSTRCLEWRL